MGELDPRWKNPPGNAPEQLYLWAQDVIRELRKGDYLDGVGSGTVSNVDNTQLADMAAATIKGRAAGAGGGDPQDLTASQVVAIIVTADGAGSGLDADLLDGQSSAFYSPASVSGTAAAILASLLTVDGAGSGLAADLLDGLSSASFAAALDGPAISDVSGLQAALDPKADDSTTFTAGAGLTGGGTLGANRTFDVVGSTSIIVGADDVQRAALTGAIQASQNSNATTATVDIAVVIGDGTNAITTSPAVK